MLKSGNISPIIRAELSENNPIKQKVIMILWPVAAVFFAVYIPVTFFILKDTLQGWILLSTFLFFLFTMVIYLKTQNIRMAGHMLAMLGFPVLMPWLISGGPSGAGLWWSLVNVVWVFFVTNKKAAIFWSAAHLIVATVIVLLSQIGLFKIAYPIPELFNFLFAFLTIFFLIYLFDSVREYYLKLVQKQAGELMIVNNDLILANNELEQFAYAASHDLQEPLRTISNFTKVLDKKHTGYTDKESQQYLEFIINASAKMQNLISDLLNFSKIGKNVIFASVDCNEILKEVIAEMNATIKENNAKVMSASLPVLRANEIELKRLFQNLISNGIKFHRKEITPKISISVESKEKEYVFAFSDNGIGIEEQYLDKIFVVFQRLHNVSEYPGTGLGLAICKKIVLLHGGKIWVKSKPGEGSTFYFTISKEIQ